MVSTAILVHGAWADGSSWSKVIPHLLNRGLSVLAVQLPLTSLEADVAVVERALAIVAGPVVLVGHSYGGVVITQAGNDPKVSMLVYVAGWLPDKGESVASLSANAEPASLAAEVRPDAQGFLRLTEAGVRGSFAQDLTDAEAGVLFATQGPANARAFAGAITNPAWRYTPSWYVLTTSDRAIPPSLQRTMARHAGAKIVEIDSSHVPMLSDPASTAASILRATG